VGAHGDADIRRLGGLRKFLPTTHWTFLVSCLAIAGVPLFSPILLKDGSWSVR
jgi:NADH-quinone oxidoreductase subunit L